MEGTTCTNTDDFPRRATDSRMSIRISAEAPADKVREVVKRGTDRSVIFDSISASVPISVDITTMWQPTLPGRNGPLRCW